MPKHKIVEYNRVMASFLKLTHTVTTDITGTSYN